MLVYGTVIYDIPLSTTASMMAEERTPIATPAGIPNITFLCVALLQFCRSATHFFLDFFSCIDTLSWI